MAPIRLARVISCSSEDGVSCARNLLTSDSFKKWSTGKSGGNKASVILQLEAEQQITGVDIGNNGSAFVELLVANSAGKPYGQYLHKCRCVMCVCVWFCVHQCGMSVLMHQETLVHILFSYISSVSNRFSTYRLKM